LFIFFVYFFYFFIIYYLDNKKIMAANSENEATETLSMKEINKRFKSAICNNSITEAEDYLNRGADLHKTDSDGDSYLHLAVVWSLNVETVEWLIQKGAVIDHRNSDGKTPLNQHLTIYLSGTKITKALVSAGANVNTVDNFGHYPLYYAIDRQNMKAIELLLQNHASVDIVDELGHGAFYYAIHSGKTAIVDLFLKYNVAHLSPHEKENELQIAIPTDNTYLVKRFINESNINNIDEKGQTPIFKALKTSSIKSTKLLVKKGASVNVADKNGNTPLHYAMAYNDGNIDLVGFLLEKGADPLAHSNEDRLPRCYTKYPEIQDLLILAEENRKKNQAKLTSLCWKTIWLYELDTSHIPRYIIRDVQGDDELCSENEDDEEDDFCDYDCEDLKKQRTQ
jgi:ankyrin repeat protein